MMKRRNLIAVCLAVACMLLCCGCKDKGGTILIGSSESQGQEDFSEEEPVSAAEPSPQTEIPGTIRVYVCGAVANPGVVEIPQGSRVEDALAAAGGFAETAGREAVNLADWVNDGQKLYFPTEGEALEMEQSQTEADVSSGLVNINTADVATLCTLSGIGESRARDIVAYREANGGFASCEDIMNVPGIKTAVYEKISDKITVK